GDPVEEGGVIGARGAQDEFVFDAFLAAVGQQQVGHHRDEIGRGPEAVGKPLRVLPGEVDMGAVDSAADGTVQAQRLHLGPVTSARLGAIAGLPRWLRKTAVLVAKPSWRLLKSAARN